MLRCLWLIELLLVQSLCIVFGMYESVADAVHSMRPRSCLPAPQHDAIQQRRKLR